MLAVYFTVVAAVYFLSGSVVYLLSPLLGYVKLVLFKNVLVGKVTYYWTYLKSKALIVFRLSSVRVNVDIGKARPAKKSSGLLPWAKKLANNKLLISGLTRILRYFSSVVLFLYDIDIVFFDKTRKIVVNLARLKADNRFSISQGVVLVESDITISQVGVNHQVEVVKNLVVNASLRLDLALFGVSDVNVTVSNQLLHLPLYRLVQMVLPMIPEPAQKAAAEKSSGTKDYGDVKVVDVDFDKQSSTDAILKSHAQQEQHLQQFLAKLKRTLRRLTEVTKVVNQINFNLSNVAVSELYLFFLHINKSNYRTMFQLFAESAESVEFLRKIYFEVRVAKANFTLHKLNKDSPGFQLLFTYDDNCVQYMASVMDYKILMHLQDQHTVELFQVPNCDFNLQTNAIFHTLKLLSEPAYHGSSVVKIISHVSSPIVEFNSLYFGILLLHFKQVRHYFALVLVAPRKQHQLLFASYIFNYFYSSVSRLMPKLSLKLTVEDPIFLLKLLTDGVMKTISVQLNAIAASAHSRNGRFHNNPGILLTSVLAKLDFSGIRVNYQQAKFKDAGVDDRAVNDEIVSSEFVSLKLGLEGLPNLNCNTQAHIQGLHVDLTSLVILVGLAEILGDVYAKAHYFYEKNDGEDVLAAAIDPHLVPPHSKPYRRSLKATKDQYKSRLFDQLPQWLTELRFSFQDLRIVIGSRSVFIPKDLVASREPLNSNDYVDANLRKVEYVVSAVEVELRNYNKKETGDDKSIMSTIDNMDFEDDKSEAGSLSVSNSFWDVVVEVKNVAVNVFDYHKKDFKSINFVKIPKIEVVISSIGNEESLLDDNSVSSSAYLKVSTSIPDVKIHYSIFIHFVIVSSISLLKSTVLAHKHTKPAAPSPSSQSFKLKQLIKTEINLKYVELDVDFPLNFKMKFQLLENSVMVQFEKDIHFHCKLCRISIPSPSYKGYYERLLIVNEVTFVLNLLDLKKFQKQVKRLRKLTDTLVDLSDLEVGKLSFNSARLSIPFKFIIHKIFDNIGVIKKIVKQLRHSLILPEMDLTPTYIRDIPVIPNIQVTANKFLFDIADDPFESRLNMIFQSGLPEQRERISKIEYFDKLVCTKLSKDYRVEHLNGFDIRILDSKHTYEYYNDKLYKTSNGTRSVSSNQEVLEIFQKLVLLQRTFSKSWYYKIQLFKTEMSQEINNNSSYLWKFKDKNVPKDFNHKIIDGIQAPPLLSSIIENIRLNISTVDFPINKLPEYLNKIGKGMPLDMKYQMLIPIKLNLNFSELRIHLRDFPLPFVYIPLQTPGGLVPETKRPKHTGNVSVVQPVGDKMDSPLGSALVGNIVIAEEFVNKPQNIKELFIPLIENYQEEEEGDTYYSMKVPKTLASVKTFLNLSFQINAKEATRITWGASHQPTIQQVMLIFDGFTKPPIDPSDKVGFWDKLRANIHGRINLKWNENGKLDAIFKGSRDPYKLTNKDAGFILSFSNEIVVDINKDDNPKEFICVNANKIRWIAPNHLNQPLLVWSRSSEDSVFVPSLKGFNMNYLGGYYFSNSLQSTFSPVPSQYYLKVVVELTGRVNFKFGVLFERKQGLDLTSDFIPHYKVQLANPDYVKDIKNYDAYKGFRSDHIHMALGLVSKTQSYNSVHFSPNTFESFFSWWKMFSGNMSLPIRHGTIFGPSQRSKKFSVYLATIKYLFQLAPLYMCHVYRDDRIAHEDDESFNMVGIKGKIESFSVDLHQRKQPTIIHKEILNTTKKIMKMMFHIGELDFKNIDIRLMNGYFASSEKTELKVFDNDTSWFDINDFEELYLPTIRFLKPEVTIYPIMFAPRIMYLRSVSEQADENLEHYTNENSHDCLLNKTSPAEAQAELILRRIQELEKQKDYLIENNKEEGLINNLKDRLKEVQKNHDQIKQGNSEAALNENFNNQFFIHNMLFKWNISNRNLLFKFIHLMSLQKAIRNYLTHSSLRNLIENEGEPDEPKNQLNGVFSPEMVRDAQNGHSSPQAKSDPVTSFLKDLRAVNSAMLFPSEDFYIKLILPQIQLIDRDSSDSCLLVVAPDIECNVISINQKRGKNTDGKSELLEYYNIVETRNGAILNQANIFAFSKSNVLEYSSLYFSSVAYGSNNSWPPWLGMELNTNGTILEKNLMLEKTSMFLRYDRISSSVVSDDNLRKNKIIFNVPKVIISCDSDQYNTLYSLVVGLLMYSEPASKELSNKLEKLVMKTSLKERTDSYNKIKLLQKEIGILEMLENQFVIQRDYLDPSEEEHFAVVRHERLNLTDELYTLMKAISLGGSQVSEQVEWNIAADSIICHMLVGDRKPFIDIALSNSRFRRKEVYDGSNDNILLIEMMQGFNLTGDTYYQDMLSPFEDEIKDTLEDDLIDNLMVVKWSMQKPIGGIKVMKYFHIFMRPIKLQLDQQTGAAIFKYFFKERGDFSTSDDDDDAEIEGIEIKEEDQDTASSPTSASVNPFLVHRTSDSSQDSVKTDRTEELQPNEELDTMMKRASNNFNIESFKLTGISLCISYKGVGKQRLVSVNNFLIKLPTIVITRQILSFFEISMFVKKVVVKLVLQHSGKLIGNKLKSHRLKKIKQPLLQLNSYDQFVSAADLAEEKT